LKLDREGEGRDEFFEVIGKRLGDLFRDPWLATDSIVENMKRYSAQGLRYLEDASLEWGYSRITTASRSMRRLASRCSATALERPGCESHGHDGAILIDDRTLCAERRGVARAGVQFVDWTQDMWVGINMAGREDNDKGYPLRF
jgi:adenosine deaminase CECR1